MRYLYVPGCALMSYKPQLAERVKETVAAMYGPMDTLLTCCFDRPSVEPGTRIVTPCTTCADRYARDCPECTVELLLETLADRTDFPFPDYRGAEMSLQDTCSARSSPARLAAVRKLLERMNIRLREPQRSGANAKCCGQTFYGKVPAEKVAALMKARADEMPVPDVVVYCASCIMSLTVGGKRPHYLLDLLYGEPTAMPDADVTGWNRNLLAFRQAHAPAAEGKC